MLCVKARGTGVQLPSPPFLDALRLLEMPSSARRIEKCPELVEGHSFGHPWGVPAWTYILECTDGRYYVGSTRDLPQRLAQHKAGRGSQYTRHHGAERIVYSESFPSLAEARHREMQIKRWSLAKKQALIRRDAVALRIYSRSHNE